MKQSITISNILNHINQALQNRDYQNPEAMEALCRNMMFDLTSLLNDDIDFKAVVDALDDSILITDSESRVIYVNPNYKNNTGIQPDQILGKKVSDIVKEGRLFTGGAVLDVLKNGKKAFRLSNVTGDRVRDRCPAFDSCRKCKAGRCKQSPHFLSAGSTRGLREVPARSKCPEIKRR